MTSTRSLKLSDQRGFTLIEMLVVVGIIVLMSAIAMPTVGSYFQLSMNSATRDLASTIKEAYNSAVVSGQVHRLVYDLKEQTFWVESGPSTVLLHTKESKEKEDTRRKFERDSDKKEKTTFALETTVTRKKRTLPRGVEFEDILTQQERDPIKTGLAYTHIFPHGISEQTIIHLKDRSNHQASLVISPLIGMTDFYTSYVKRSDVFKED